MMSDELQRAIKRLEDAVAAEREEHEWLQAVTEAVRMRHRPVIEQIKAHHRWVQAKRTRAECERALGEAHRIAQVTA